MDTKTCSKCGWVVAMRDPSNYCPVCSTAFNYRICSMCGEVYETWAKRTVCKECYRKYVDVGNTKAMVNRRRAVYAEWLDKIKQVPPDYPKLTEAQWLEAVQHFNGCALCKSESVDTRGYFVPFKDGGRYCDWNVIPLCSDCALTLKTNLNWFMGPKRPAGLVDTITYLEVRLNAAIKEG